jgi:hypothetical protein
MQKFLGEAAVIPSTLHRIDLACGSSNQRAACVLSDGFSSLLSMISRLEVFEDQVRRDENAISCRNASKDQPYTHPTILWFADITTANVLVYIWTFKTVCLTEIAKLVYSGLVPDSNERLLSGRLSLFLIDHEIKMLCESICRSMEYLTQDKMGLYGPASTFYPLHVAYRSLKRDSSQGVNIAYCEEIVARLVGKGLRVAPYIVF